MLTVFGGNDSTFLQRASALSRVNSLVRGFRNYFALPEEPAIATQMQELDGRVEQMAQELLPHHLRDDPAWISRERFFLAQFDEKQETSGQGQPRLAVHDPYPEDPRTARPAAWMVKPELPPEATPQNTAIVIEDPGENQDASESKSPGVVEHSGRLYVMTHGSYVTVADDVLIVKKRKVEICRRPLAEVGLLFL